jgi:2-C-methyl-D-erythritol 2,4-cyclodiphosphate synthase
MRIGQGYDVHRLVKDRKLILGGVTIPFEKGLLGHSDADVLVHSVCDGLLGAAGLGDMGHHFPDSDPHYLGIDSMKLLASVVQMVTVEGFVVGNIDSTIIAQAPKIEPYKVAMAINIAKVVDIDPNRVNVKATTTEGLGIFGRGEGIGAMCMVLLKNSSSVES